MGKQILVGQKFFKNSPQIFTIFILYQGQQIKKGGEKSWFEVVFFLEVINVRRFFFIFQKKVKTFPKEALL